MADYEFRPGGSLKLKGGDDAAKKKKKSKGKESLKDKLLKGKRSDSPAADASPAGSSSGEQKTEAEKHFEEKQRRLLERKVQQLAKKTHKDRVLEFNNKLEALSEHHDIPKVGPG